MQYGLKLFFLIWILIIFVAPGCVCNKLSGMGRKKKNVKFIFLIYVLNVVFALGLHFMLRKTVNVVYTVRRLLQLDVAYSEVQQLAYWFNGCICFAILCELGINRIKKVRIDIAQKNRRIVFFWCTIMIFVCFIGYAFQNQGKKVLVINEVAANNNRLYMDEYDSYCDYIEFYNKGNLICELDTIYVSDDIDNLKKIKLSGGKVNPGGFVILGLDKVKSVYYIEQNEQSRWYPPEELNQENMKKMFSVSEKGEYIYLSDDLGNVIDSIYTGIQEEDIVICRTKDGGDIWELRRGTPGASNCQAELPYKIAEPVLSHESGCYQEGFELSITTEGDASIYYTLDGSTPDKNAMKYSDTIMVYDKSVEENIWRNIPNVITDWKENTVGKTAPVDKAFVVKAIAIDEKGAKSDIVQATYLINRPEYDGKNIISITTDPELLFGEDGIYVTGKTYDDWYLAGGTKSGEERPEVNFEKRGRKSEIPAVVELIEGDVVKVESIGLKIQGGGSRYEAIKRFAAIARKEYGGSKWFQHSWFEGMNTHAVNFRPGFANAVLPYLVKDRNVVTQRSLPADIFLNGEYWYSGYVQERITNSLLEEKYGLEEDSVCIIEDSRDEEVPFDIYGMQEICEYVDNHDMSREEYYEEFCNLVDIDSYVDFLCINAYFAHMDWEEHKNFITWKEIPEGKWRFVIYDLDSIDPETFYSSDYYNVREWAQINPFIQKGEFVDRSLKENKLYPALYNNNSFREKMVLTFMDLMNANFESSNVEQILKAWDEDLAWNDSFFVKRPDYMYQYMEEEYKLQGEKVFVELEAEGEGSIKINSITPDLSEGSWKGLYYTDYPIEVTAVPKEGYRFVGWSGNIVSDKEQMQVHLKDLNTKIVAIFEKVEL